MTKKTHLTSAKVAHYRAYFYKAQFTRNYHQNGNFIYVCTRPGIFF